MVDDVGDLDRASRAFNRAIAGALVLSTGSRESKQNGTSPRRTATKTEEDLNPEPRAKKRKARHGHELDTDGSLAANLDLADMGGVDDVIDRLEGLIVMPINMAQVYMSAGISPPRGILLHGPPGCGKTMIANAFARRLGVPMISVSAPSIVSGMSGESEKALREHFESAVRMAPCLMFIDEIDAITPKRESAQREMEKRIVAQLLTCMDDLSLDKTGGQAVIVLAATNRPGSLDPALRRGGRFDKEIHMSVPNEPVREQILRALTRRSKISGNVDFLSLAKKTAAFVGADLNDLVSTAGAVAIERALKTMRMDAVSSLGKEDQPSKEPQRVVELDSFIKYTKEIGRHTTPAIQITNEDFMTALPTIQPSAKREGFATVPSTTWADVGALASLREELKFSIANPILDPEPWKVVGISPPSGVLLWGPPGCGKTLLAKATANESQANFISIKGPELLSKYVGDSERRVRELFTRARSSVPCIIFFDELDALAPRRDEALNEASSRVVNTLLVELDGLDSREGIYIIGATNRPDQIDAAMLRPGRLEKLLFVDLPSADERVEILMTLARQIKAGPFAHTLEILARSCEGFSGADLSSLVRQAGTQAIKNRDSLREHHFHEARKLVEPSVKNYQKYKDLAEQMGKNTL